MNEFPVQSKSLHRAFETRAVLDSVNLELRHGDFYGLVGLNGAGKTTLIRHLLGLLKPDSGQIRVFGNDPWEHRTEVYRKMGVILEHDGFSGNLSFRKNMEFFASVKGVSLNDLEHYLDSHWRETSIYSAEEKVKHFSRGQKMQASIARAFLGWPALCIFDEPVVALDMEAYEHFYSLVEEARGRGCTMLISSHVLEPIERFCNRVGVLRDGRLSELSRGDQADLEKWWQLRVNGPAEKVQEVLGKAPVGKVLPERDRLWRIALLHPERHIPEIVKMLVVEDIDVLEIRPEEVSLRDQLRGEQR